MIFLLTKKLKERWNLNGVGRVWARGEDPKVPVGKQHGKGVFEEAAGLKG